MSFFILTVNGGSSSIKFALYQTGEMLKRTVYGKVDRIGLAGTNLSFHDASGSLPELTASRLPITVRQRIPD